jgi:hypothetical protein
LRLSFGGSDTFQTRKFIQRGAADLTHDICCIRRPHREFEHHPVGIVTNYLATPKRHQDSISPFPQNDAGSPRLCRVDVRTNWRAVIRFEKREDTDPPPSVACKMHVEYWLAGLIASVSQGGNSKTWPSRFQTAAFFFAVFLGRPVHGKKWCLGIASSSLS